MLFNLTPELLIANLFALGLGMTVHEFAHNYVGWRMGDPEPARLGRDNIFSVNIPHLAQYTCSIEYTLSRIGADPENYEQILADCGWQFTEEELAMLEMFPLDTQAGETGLAEFDRAASYVANWLHFVMAHSVNHGAQIGWTSWTHTANPVFMFASGPGAERLSGNIHLEDIAFAMADAMGVTFPDPVPCNCELPVVDY